MSFVSNAFKAALRLFRPEPPKVEVPELPAVAAPRVSERATDDVVVGGGQQQPTGAVAQSSSRSTRTGGFLDQGDDWRNRTLGLGL